MKLISMKVDVEAHVFACLQDGAGRAEIKHSLLTEHVDVVDSEGSSRHQLFQPRKLNLQDVLGGFCNCLPSGKYTQGKNEFSGCDIEIRLF